MRRRLTKQGMRCCAPMLATLGDKMNRVKGYFAYLLIPAVPYLLMIYSPETMHPVYKYLANGKGSQYVWAAMFSVLLFALNFGLVADAEANNVKPSLIAFIKWYLFLVGCLVSAYLLLFNNAVPKYAFIGMGGAIIGFYIFMGSSRGRSV